MRLDRFTSASARFDHSEAIDHFRHLCLECIDTPVVSMKDCFDQKILSLLSDVENYFVHCFKGTCSLNLVEYEKN